MKSKTGGSFSRSSRLNTAEDFKQVFQDNYRVSDDCINLLIGRKDSSRPRLGFAVAKKQIKLAVGRNRIKRLIRESFRLHQSELPNHDIVAMVRFNILKLSHQQIFDRLDKHWRTVINKCENS
jgi:ribonuclease P protein component